jgi:hypothetical protein
MSPLAYPPVDESLDYLRRAGWSVGDVATATRWVVGGAGRGVERGCRAFRQEPAAPAERRGPGRPPKQDGPTAATPAPPGPQGKGRKAGR